MKLFFSLIFLLFNTCLVAQTDTVQQRIILIGDAGALVNGKSPVLEAVKKNIKFDKKTTVIYLGDNLYDYGLPDEFHDDYLREKEALDSQINIARGTPAKVYMIPGNHDWGNGDRAGQYTIVRQQQYVDFAGLENVKFFPEGGCPGPVEVNLSKDVVLVIFDSQWWIHPYEKPGIESDCDNKLPEQVLAQMEDILNKNYKKLVLFACHHPFKSNGPHGGYYTWKQHIFPFTDMNRNAYIPLPILGSAYPIVRSVFGTPQDIKHPKYQNMITEFNKVLKNHPHVIRLHGHEHTLQLIKNDSLTEVISGAGCKTNRVSMGGDAKYVARKLGFAVLEVSESKKVKAEFYELNDKNPDSLTIGYNDVIEDFTKQPELPREDTTIAIPIYSKLVLAPASTQYKEAHGLKKLVNGNNYRKEWNTPVYYKVFDINSEKGGFKISGIGGGKQTKSLKLTDKQGREWALRTIDKDPAEAIPVNLRGSFAQDIVQDLISAAHPYAPLTVPDLARAAGIPTAQPELFYVPDDRALGYYRPLFAKKIAMLELRDLYKDDDGRSSLKIFNKMRDDNNKTVDQQAVLNARLLDMLLGDYDRHFDQWKWVEGDTGKGKIYIPIPRDRDQVFFKSDGLLVRFASRRFLPYMRGFKKDFSNINLFNMVAKDFDRVFLNNLDETKWTEVAQQFSSKVTDTVIKTAVLKMPPEIYAIRGKEITEALISRRNQLEKESLKYYRLQSQVVQVIGRNKNEYFHLTNQNDSVKLDVHSYTSKDTSFLMYSRTFDVKHTKELQLYGFGGEDVFRVDPDVRSRIKLRIIGGRGLDSFHISNKSKTFIYDNVKDSNILIGNRHVKNRISNDPAANNYELRSYKYTMIRFPRLVLGYNADDGIFIGTGLLFRKYGFRKEPFASEQRVSVLAAIAKKAYQFNYSGTFVNFWNNNTLVVNVGYSEPTLNNFFGFGNETKIDPAKGFRFYRVRYDEAKLDVFLKRIKSDKLSYYIGPSVYHYWNKLKDNRKYILGQPSIVIPDSGAVFATKTYVGGKAGVEYNNLNNELFPTRGVQMIGTLTSMHPVNGKSYTLNKAEANMTIYASLKDEAKIITVLKLGAGHIFNDKFEYYQALSLGANNNLRGFRKTRFSGQSLAYGSLEFRIKLLKGKSYVLPGQVGLLAFGDAGRVWYKGENSNKIHAAYGGGFYFVPFNMVILSAAVAVSGEEQLFNLSVGTKINLTF
jgi:hypothetical protein